MRKEYSHRHEGDFFNYKRLCTTFCLKENIWKDFHQSSNSGHLWVVGFQVKVRLFWVFFGMFKQCFTSIICIRFIFTNSLQFFHYYTLGTIHMSLLLCTQDYLLRVLFPQIVLQNEHCFSKCTMQGFMIYHIRGWQTMAPRPNLACHLFLYSL